MILDGVLLYSYICDQLNQRRAIHHPTEADAETYSQTLGRARGTPMKGEGNLYILYSVYKLQNIHCKQ